MLPNVVNATAARANKRAKSSDIMDAGDCIVTQVIRWHGSTESIVLYRDSG